MRRDGLRIKGRSVAIVENRFSLKTAIRRFTAEMRDERNNPHPSGIFMSKLPPKDSATNRSPDQNAIPRKFYTNSGMRLTD
jgi:hypothetical protein